MSWNIVDLVDEPVDLQSDGDASFRPFTGTAHRIGDSGEPIRAAAAPEVHATVTESLNPDQVADLDPIIDGNSQEAEAVDNLKNMTKVVSTWNLEKFEEGKMGRDVIAAVEELQIDATTLISELEGRNSQTLSIVMRARYFEISEQFGRLADIVTTDSSSKRLKRHPTD